MREKNWITKISEHWPFLLHSGHVLWFISLNLFFCLDLEINSFLWVRKLFPRYSMIFSFELLSKYSIYLYIYICSYQCCIQTLFGYTVFSKLSLVILKNSQWLQLSVQKYLMFNAWGEGYLCLLKRFLFLTIRRLYSFSFYVKYKNKVTRTFWLHFLGHAYCSNSTKIYTPWSSIYIGKSRYTPMITS